MPSITAIRPIQHTTHFEGKKTPPIETSKQYIETILNQAGFNDTTVQIQNTVDNRKILRIYPANLTQVPAILSALKKDTFSQLTPEAALVQKALQTAGIPGVIWRTLRAPEQYVYHIALPKSYFSDSTKKEALHTVLINLPNISCKRPNETFKTYVSGENTPQRESFTTQIIEHGFVMSAFIHHRIVEFWLKDDSA